MSLFKNIKLAEVAKHKAVPILKYIIYFYVNVVFLPSVEYNFDREALVKTLIRYKDNGIKAT